MPLDPGLTAFGACGPPLADGDHVRAVVVIDGFYRAGAFVFGGGHLVLPQLARPLATFAPG